MNKQYYVPTMSICLVTFVEIRVSMTLRGRAYRKIQGACDVEYTPFYVIRTHIVSFLRLFMPIT